MYVSKETPSQTASRLRAVIQTAELVIYDGHFCFQEFGVADFPSHLLNEALAFVRDKDVWSALAPTSDSVSEKFLIFSFHFKPELDNSGFVGWLASHIKTAVGSGVFVVCGQNTLRGGIFDYWGVPVSVASAVINEVNKLRVSH